MPDTRSKQCPHNNATAMTTASENVLAVIHNSDAYLFPSHCILRLLRLTCSISLSLWNLMTFRGIRSSTDSDLRLEDSYVLFQDYYYISRSCSQVCYLHYIIRLSFSLPNPTSLPPNPVGRVRIYHYPLSVCSTEVLSHFSFNILFTASTSTVLPLSYN